MSLVHEVKGFAFLCDQGGRIINILRDDFGLAENNPKGKLFANLVNPENRKLSLDFLLEVKTQKISFDFRLNIDVKGTKYAFYFIGINLDKDMLIIGADNHKEAIDFANHLQQINNEQANIIRQLLKKESFYKQDEQKENEVLFNEITHLNNELVNLQRQLTQKNKELERLNELKNRFLGMAAHDLRNPLGVVMNYSEFLIDEVSSDLSDEHSRFLHTINNSAEFMLEIVEDLLDYSKIESNKVDLRLNEFDLIAKIKQQVELLNAISDKKGIKIIIETEYETLAVSADNYKIDQVLINLITNAIKFSHPNREIIIKVIKQDVNVVISVTDSGTGIKPEHIEKLFVPYSKASTAGTHGEKSTGLGLSIVKRIVEAHSGKIWVESEVNKGTTFFVSLPFKILN